MESQRLTHRTVKNKEETICKKSENPGNLTGMSQKTREDVFKPRMADNKY